MMYWGESGRKNNYNWNVIDSRVRRLKVTIEFFKYLFKNRPKTLLSFLSFSFLLFSFLFFLILQLFYSQVHFNAKEIIEQNFFLFLLKIKIDLVLSMAGCITLFPLQNWPMVSKSNERISKKVFRSFDRSIPRDYLFPNFIECWVKKNISKFFINFS